VPSAVPPGAIPNGSITALQIQTGTITAAQIAAAAGNPGQPDRQRHHHQRKHPGRDDHHCAAGRGDRHRRGCRCDDDHRLDPAQQLDRPPKTSINADGSIAITSSGGTVIFKIGPDGTIYWYSPGGTLLMTLQPCGNQLIYASLTGPSGWDFEPPDTPAVLFSVSSAVSSATYANAPAVNALQGLLRHG